MSEAMSPAEKISFVAEQIAQVRSGESNKIFCPYCQGKNRPGTEFCCELMTKAAKAVLDHEQTVNEIQLQEAIAGACHPN